MVAILDRFTVFALTMSGYWFAATETDRAELSETFEPSHLGKAPWVVHFSSSRSPKSELPVVRTPVQEEKTVGQILRSTFLNRVFSASFHRNSGRSCFSTLARRTRPRQRGARPAPFGSACSRPICARPAGRFPRSGPRCLLCRAAAARPL